jgi:hypothetical protein
MNRLIWAASAGGFPAMTERVAFLMKDIALFAVSFYLLKQDLVRASRSGELLQGSFMTGAPTGLRTGKVAESA